MGQRGFKVVADLLVKIVVLLLADIFFGTCPDGVGLVDGFPLAGLDHAARLASDFFIARVYQIAVFPFLFFHEDGQADVVRIFVDDALDLPGLRIVHRVFAQVQGDAGAACGSTDVFHFKGATTAGATVADPAHAFVLGQSGTAGFDGNFVGHDKAGIKAHAKLANQLRIGFLVAAEFADKVFGAALGNRA